MRPLESWACPPPSLHATLPSALQPPSPLSALLTVQYFYPRAFACAVVGRDFPLPFPAPQRSCSPSRLEPSSLTPSLPLSTRASPAWPEASRPRPGLHLKPWAVSWGCSQNPGKGFCRPRGGSTQSCYCSEPHPRTLTPQHPQPGRPSWPARPVFPSHPWAAGYS